MADTEKTESQTEEKKSQIDFNVIKTFMDEQYKKINTQIKNLSNEVKNKYLPETETKLKDNFLTSLGVAFVTGLFAGLILMLFGKCCGKKK